jgi:AAA domain, putative AbiEii toxin, Type IV TA system
MHLKRVIVPDFRVLKDVDLTFEPDLVPRIFPLGSLNGGGKSTLLQLVFTLLHCIGNQERIPYLQNMLDGFEVNIDARERDLATIEINVDSKDVSLFFFCYTLDSVDKEIEALSSNNQGKPDYLSLVDPKIKIGLLNLICQKIQLDRYAAETKILVDEINNLLQVLFLDTREFDPIVIENYKQRILDILANVEKSQPGRDYFGKLLNRFREQTIKEENLVNYRKVVQDIVESIKDVDDSLARNSRKCNLDIDTIQLELLKVNYFYMCELNQEDKKVSLFCKFTGLSLDDFKTYCMRICQNILLTAPVTQVFRFLNKVDRKLLFKSGGESYKYYFQLEAAKPKLPGFFAYDLVAVNLLIKAFITARDNDFRAAISNGGGLPYGDSYQQLFKDLERLLVDKRVNIDDDFTGISFSKLDSNGNTIELYPEDLSHGELKRLSLYMWLKSNKIENAIVLMDEVEIALHPDWQFQIVRDLQTWAPNNQYILATHSYELCKALTPAHVKEIVKK